MEIQFRQDKTDKGLSLSYLNDGTFFLDKEWNIIYSSYHTIGEDNTRKEVKLTDSQEKELLQKVQKELNQFLDKMKEQLGR